MMTPTRNGLLPNSMSSKMIWNTATSFGTTIMFNDLKDLDEEYHKSLMSIQSMGSAVTDIGYDFTMTVDTVFGGKKTVELVPGGADLDVTEDNYPEYIEACLKYRLLGQYGGQLNELLLGVFEVIPEPMLTIFDFQDLELLMCGLPQIDMDDWMDNTVYLGEYEYEGRFNEVCMWFWDIVSEYDHELKARLLQFVTGTSGVPSKGFGYLTDYQGIRRFTIQSISYEIYKVPISQ